MNRRDFLKILGLFALSPKKIYSLNKNTKNASYAGASGSEVLVLSDVNLEDIPRFPSTFSELDRVLGGGIVPGSVILLGGSPGIGKSSILSVFILPPNIEDLSMSNTFLFLHKL